MALGLPLRTSHSKTRQSTAPKVSREFASLASRHTNACAPLLSVAPLGRRFRSDVCPSRTAGAFELPFRTPHGRHSPPGVAGRYHRHLHTHLLEFRLDGETVSNANTQ